MKNQYGKENTRNPNAPTQGGFTPAGGGQGKNQGRQPTGPGTNRCKTPQQNRPTQPNNNWGTGDKSKKDTGHK